MSEYQQLQIRARGERLGCDSRESAPLVTRAIAATRVRAAGGQRRAEVRMNPAKRRDRHTVAENTAQRPITTVLARPKAVAMFDAGLPAGERSFPWSDVV